MDNMSGSSQDQRPAEETLKKIGQKYALMGNWRVKSWQAWVLVGAAVGILSGVIYVANRKGEFSAGEAASKKQTLTLQSPNGGEVLFKERVFEIRWSSVAPVKRGGAKKVDIFIYGEQPNESTDCKKVPCPLRPLKSLIGFSVVKETENDGIFEWKVSERIPDGKYLMRINVSGNDRDADESDSYFKIATPPRITVISPNGGETWTRGEAKNILWTSTSESPITPIPPPKSPPTPISPPTYSLTPPPTPIPLPTPVPPLSLVNIFLDGAVSVCAPGAVCRAIPYLLARATADDGSFTWTVGKDIEGRPIPDGIYFVRVAGENGEQDQSDAPFSIVTPPISGSLSVSLDPSTPSARLVTAGSVDVPLTVLRFRASNEPIYLQQLALKLSGQNPTKDVLKVSAWDGAVKVAEAVPGVDSPLILYFVTRSSQGILIPQEGGKVVTMKADFARIGIGESVNPGDRIEAEPDMTTAGSLNTFGVGKISGVKILAKFVDLPDLDRSVWIFRSIPTLTKISVPSMLLSDGNKVLYRFSITPQAGNQPNGVSLYRFTLGTTLTDDDGELGNLSLSGLKLFAFDYPNFSSPAYSADGQLNNGPYYSSGPVNEGASGNPIYFNPVNPASQAREAINVPSGTRYFELRGNVSGADSGDSISVNLQGDGALVPVNSASYIDGVYAPDFENSFIWSGNSTTTHSGSARVSNPDWTNGYLVPGLPEKGMSANTFSL